MAQPVYLLLKANGAAVQGEGTHIAAGLETAIECIYFEQWATTSREYGAGMATGRREYRPLVIRKQIDRASPLLWKALTENQVLDGTFKFFRPNPNGEGSLEQFYMVEIKQARLAAIREYVSETINPATANDPPLEEVSFVFHTSSWTYADQTTDEITHQDTWVASP